MNSLIHGLEDKKAGIITISAHMLEEDLLELKYSDNGVGIDEDHLKYVFDPFFTTNRSKGGSGLGLNIVYNIVTGKLGGKITCYSVVGEGTTFVMHLPVKEIHKNKND